MRAATTIYRQINHASEQSHVLDAIKDYYAVFAALAFFTAFRRSTSEGREFLSHSGAAGRDRVLDRIAQRFDPDRSVGENNACSPHYGLLVKAMDAPPAEKPELIKKFLDGWYRKAYKNAPDYEAHASEAYSGYWSWEAAAVVMLWEIDDSSFRDHPNYPDALVDYFRNGERSPSHVS